MKNQKLAVLFPGLGYTCDKPLLYYSGKLAVKKGYEIIQAAYGGFPKNVKGDPEKMKKCFESALEQTEEMLKKVPFADYGDVVLIGKSIGTQVAARYAEKKKLKARGILFTPLEATFPFLQGDAVAFHGTADPWAGNEPVARLCGESGIPLYLTENANHSLETGDVAEDIKNIGKVMEIVSGFLH